jgi:predicted dehydrogenase
MEMKKEESRLSDGMPRRHFVKATTLAAAGFPFVITGRAAADDPIRIGVIGCGGRGTGAALNALQAQTRVIYPKVMYHTEDAANGAQIQAKNVRIIALADLFKDRLDRCREQLKKVGNDVADDACFTGFDACKKVLAMPDVNYVILATPPNFRPMQLRAAVEAGKHAFIEKPVAVDGPGVRSIIESGEMAKKKNLGIAAGVQRRHQPDYQETIKRIHDGAIGEIVEARCYWNGGELWYIPRQPGWSEMEYQIRNWCYYTWLSGDHVVEQHVHNLDIMNWLLRDHPIRASALGGRQKRTGKDFGHIYDHFATEFEYPNGIFMFSQCRQMNGCTNRVTEAVRGTKGTSNCLNTIQAGGQQWKFSGPKPDPYEQTHADLIESIRKGSPINEARSVAESTLLGIMARVSAYTGKTVTWDEVFNSKQDLSPAKWEFGDIPVPEVAIPGEYLFS